jgi:hypothetical protein
VSYARKSISSSDPYSLSYDEVSSLFRHEFGVLTALPRKVQKPLGEHHRRMAEHWAEAARSHGRPPHWEFTREVPYGPFSRSHWKYIRLAMRSAFLSGVHDAMGTTYETTEGGGRSLALVTGITM